MYHGDTIELTRLDGGIAHLCLNQPGSPVNTLNRAVLTELKAALDCLQGTELRGLICSSGKKGFIAGADIGEFTPMFKGLQQALEAWCAESNALFCALETLPFPTVSIIRGHALGGGLEFALATDFRLASPDASFGFPETGLGICPGFGGTVRAPRVMDPESALLWVSSGNNYNAAAALTSGLVETLVDADLLLDAAREQIEQAWASPEDWQALRQRKLTVVTDAGSALELVLPLQQAANRGQGRHNPAPTLVLEVMGESLALSRDQALAAEQALFVRLARSEVALNLIGLFTNEQWLRQKNRRLLAEAGDVQQAAVLGAGIMGGGIAYQSALKGVPVHMKDIAQGGLDAGMAEAQKQLHKLVAKGRLSEASAESVLARISPSLSFDQYEQVDLLIEAVVENAGVKAKVLAEAETHLGEDAILTSNTSTISITELGKALRRPGRFCGMHFFNPVPVMPLVEVIRGEQSSEAAIATTVQFAQRLGKTPIVVNDCPGFLVNRILFPYFGAFSRLLKDGADYLQIDAAMEEFGWPMGPAYLLDVVGIDTAVHAQAVMAEGFPQRMRYGFTSAMDMLAEAGEYGQKTGSGFYRYAPGKDGRLQKQPDAAIAARIRALHPQQRSFGDAQIVERMMLAMCLETVRCLEDGIVDSAIEADMGLILGLGFPRFRGGALRYIDHIGARAFCDMAKAHADLGPLYTPPALLLDMAAKDQRFYA
ncbi:MAG: fatty acid oxidation complex subunit alpha FadB [Pseudomonadales bacterium]|nr:fatty acid oxidation complex subunit alpha FadB [Pseudomonadales bacterium]